MIQVQYSKLQQKGMAGIVPVGQSAGLFNGLMKRKPGKILYKLRIEVADLLFGELCFVPDQLVYRCAKIGRKFEQKHKIRCALGIFPLGYCRLTYSEEVCKLLLGNPPLAP